MLIFEQSCPTRHSEQFIPEGSYALNIPEYLLRKDPLRLPEVSELQVVRHFTNLSHKNFSIDSNFYPLGSCTMKYNPKIAHKLASLEAFTSRHPLTPAKYSQGYLQCLYELQQMLCQVSGMDDIALSPMAGAQGEFVGIAMIQAYHRQRGELHRNEMLVPISAHGTNVASAVMCGYKIVEVPVDSDGNLDISSLKLLINNNTAGLMLTNPSTLGVFEKNISEVSDMIHRAGGQMYYDGANLNAILGRIAPSAMGFDVMHINLHKTFATPHGGGGPGAGPVAAKSHLVPYLPVPRVTYQDSQYQWLTHHLSPHSIGQTSAFMGNAGVLLRAFVYLRMVGKTGLQDISDTAVLNANYMKHQLSQIGYKTTYSKRYAAHEFIIQLDNLKKEYNITALDLAKYLLDQDIHAPTVYFPTNIPECWLIEPTETESKDTLDHFIQIMSDLWKIIKKSPEVILNSPKKCYVTRLDEAQAAKQLKIIWRHTNN